MAWFCSGLAIFTLAGTASPASAQETDANVQFTVDEELADRGEELFESRQCMACHHVGDGELIGPDLAGVVEKRGLEWIRRMIREPETMTVEDSTARQLKAEYNGIQMPNPSVTDEEIEALIHYIASESDE